MNTPGSVTTVYFDTVSHFTTDDSIDNSPNFMQSSQDSSPAVYTGTTPSSANVDNQTKMESLNDLPPPIHTTPGPLHPTLVNATGTATTFQLHDDGPVPSSNTTLKGKGKERSGSPIPAERVSSPSLGMGATAGRALSPLPELQDLGAEERRIVGVGEQHETGSVKPEYAQHPNGSDGWLPTENAPMQTQGQNFDQNPNVMPQPITMPAVAGGSPTGIASPIARVGSPIRDKNESNLPQQAILDDGQGYTNGHQRQTTGGTSIRSHHRDSPSPGRAQGFVAAPIGGGSASLARSTSRKSTHTAADGRPIPGSGFVNGAGTTGPFSTAEENEELMNRRLEANASLTPKQRSKIAKNEAKNGRKLSKIIKSEAKIEQASLQTAIDELAALQKIQKNTIKSEARLSASHSKLLNAFKKTEAAYLSAKLRYDREQAELNAEASALETLRENAKDATEKVQDKAAEVDALRRVLAVDEREREVRLGELSGRGMGTIRRKGSVGVSQGGGVNQQPIAPGMITEKTERRRSFFGGSGVRN